MDKDGKAVHDKKAILEEREKAFELDTSKPFKLNAGTVGVCEPVVLISQKPRLMGLSQIGCFIRLNASPRLRQRRVRRITFFL